MDLGLQIPSIPSMASDSQESDTSDGELTDSYAYKDESAAVQSNYQEGEADLDTVEGNKADEPYAQLIFRAFMSRGDHAMTLQEIYQWFQENTDKAVPQHKGWQNSIRHNLSMNAAFIKRDRKETPDGPMTDRATPKRSTEWVLEDWAIQKGVQSTTRYRRTNKSSRKANSSHYPGRSHDLSARARSGRKGGIATHKTRLATDRAAVRRRHQYDSVIASRIPRNGFSPQQTFCSSQAASIDFGPSSGTNLATPPEMAGGELIFADNTMRSPPSMGSVTSYGYYFGPEQYQQVQLHSPVSHSYPVGNPYRSEDITAVYEVPSMQSAAAHSVEASHLAQLSTDFGNLFTQDIGEYGSGTVMRVGNMEYNLGDG